MPRYLQEAVTKDVYEHYGGSRATRSSGLAEKKMRARRAAREERALGGPADGRRALDHAMIDPTAVVQRGDAISLRPFRRHE